MLTAVLCLLALLAGAAAMLYAPDKRRARLEADYAAFPSAFVEACGVRLHVRDTGPREAPAIVLLHGFGASLHTWDAWAQALETGRRVVRLDLPGFGLTGADPTGDYTDSRTVAVLLALLDRLGVARFDLVGSSMGGRVAWTTAALHPERVDRLALMAPDGFAGPGGTYGAKPTVPLMMKALPHVLPRRLLRRMLTRTYVDPAALTPALFARYRDLLLAPGVRRAILRRIPQHVRTPPEPLLARIRAPTLLLWGDGDRLIPPARAADYLRAVPNARLVTLPGVGHVPQEEAPEASLAALRAFLDEPGAV